MVPVITSFIDNKKQYEYAAGNPNGKAKDIDKGETFIPEDVPPGNFQVVHKHERIDLSVGI